MHKKRLKTALMVAAFVLGTIPALGIAEVTTHISVRERIESTIEGNIQADPANGNYRATQQTKISISGYYESVKAKVKIKDHRDWSHHGHLGVYEAYTQYGDEWYFRAGRQEFVMDEGRLLGNQPWLNGLAHDGILIGYKGKGRFNLEIFAVRESDNDWVAFHPTTQIDNIQIALPIVYQTDAAHSYGNDETFGFTTGVFAKADGDLNWRIEGYGQQVVTKVEGVEDVTESGLFLSARVGYKIMDGFAPVLNVDYTTAAGDGDATEFSNPYGNVHQYNGNMGIDFVTNGGGLISTSLTNSSKCLDGTLVLALNYFMLADAKVAEADDAALGFEFDLEYSVALSDSLHFQIGESLFFDQGSRAPDGKNVTAHDWTYVQLSLHL